MSDLIPVGPLMAKVIHQDEKYLNDDGQLVDRKDAAIHKFDPMKALAQKVFGDNWSTRVQFVPPTFSENAAYIGRLGGKVVTERKLAHLHALHRQNSRNGKEANNHCFKFYLGKTAKHSARTFYVIERNIWKARRRIRAVRIGRKGGQIRFGVNNGVKMKTSMDRRRRIKLTKEQLNVPGIYEKVGQGLRKIA
jgi:hypothetical protein